MQQLILHKKLFYARIDEAEYSPIAYEREEKLKYFERLIEASCKDKDAAFEALKMSQSTYCRIYAGLSWMSEVSGFSFCALSPFSRAQWPH